MLSSRTNETDSPQLIGASPERRSDGANARPRLAVLDGLRLVAALMVVSFHYVSGGQQYWHAPAGRPVFPVIHLVTAYGWMGVNLFFVISGFVICMSSWGRSLGQFFVSRVSRLYPMFWIAVCFTTAVVTLVPADHPRLPAGEIMANLTMFPTALGAASVDGVYWTLWNEALFYLLFAIVVWRGVNYRRAVLFCVLWTTASVIASAINVPAISTVVDQEYSMYFIAGIAMYLMYRFKPNLLLWCIVGFSLLLALNRFGTRLNAIEVISGEQQNWWVGAAVVTACFGVVLAVALGWLDRLAWRGLVPAGAMTYPLYLLHGVAGCALINHFSPKAPRYLVLAGVVTLMLLLSWTCHRYLERPASRMLRRGLSSALTTIRQPVAHADPTDVGTTDAKSKATEAVQPRPQEPVTSTAG